MLKKKRKKKYVRERKRDIKFPRFHPSFLFRDRLWCHLCWTKVADNDWHNERQPMASLCVRFFPPKNFSLSFPLPNKRFMVCETTRRARSARTVLKIEIKRIFFFFLSASLLKRNPQQPKTRQNSETKFVLFNFLFFSLSCLRRLRENIRVFPSQWN